MKKIKLTRGYSAEVDNKDYEWLNSFKWHAQLSLRKDGTVRTVYANRDTHSADGARTTQRMHCLIMGAKGIDHRDGNGLNNRRYNLRPATITQNGGNQKLSGKNSSGYKGVSWCKRDKKWVAKTQVNGNHVYLGRFTDILDARNAYDVAALKYFGPFALTNTMMENKLY